MMSRCFTWFPIGGLGEPYLYQNLRDFTRIGDFTWMVSDCEELVGVFTGDGEVGLVQKNNLSVYRLCGRALRAREANNRVSV